MKNTISSGFIWNHKIGDNIVYNLNALELIYHLYNNTPELEEKEYLRKTMVINIASVCEAVLYDFIIRIKMSRHEKLEVAQESINRVMKEKKVRMFGACIKLAKDNDLFDINTVGFYKALFELNDLRSRIHIQNVPPKFKPDDVHTFTEKVLRDSELILEVVMKRLQGKYPRPDHTHYVKDFILPWDKYVIPDTLPDEY